MYVSSYQRRRSSIGSINSETVATGKELIEIDLDKGAMPIFGIPLLGFNDHWYTAPQDTYGNMFGTGSNNNYGTTTCGKSGKKKVKSSVHSDVAEHHWKKIAYHVLEKREKFKPSVIRQMLMQYYKRELEDEVLLKDFALGVRLSDRHRYHRIIEKNGEYVCIRRGMLKEKKKNTNKGQM